MALARVQYTSIGFGFGRGRPCSPIIMRLQNVCETHQLEYDAEPAERSAGGAPRGGEAVDRSDGVESDSSAILDALRNPAALAYEPNPRGMESARRAVAG